MIKDMIAIAIGLAGIAWVVFYFDSLNRTPSTQPCICTKAIVTEIAVSDSVITVMSKYNPADLTPREYTSLLGDAQ